MSANDIPFPIPSDFDERARNTNTRIAGGESISHEQIAHALGLPVEFIAAAIAVYAAVLGGNPVVIDPTIPPQKSKLH
jgi:hypothetical protein